MNGEIKMPNLDGKKYKYDKKGKAKFAKDLMKKLKKKRKMKAYQVEDGNNQDYQNEE